MTCRRGWIPDFASEFFKPSRAESNQRRVRRKVPCKSIYYTKLGCDNKLSSQKQRYGVMVRRFDITVHMARTRPYSPTNEGPINPGARSNRPRAGVLEARGDAAASQNPAFANSEAGLFFETSTLKSPALTSGRRGSWRAASDKTALRFEGCVDALTVFLTAMACKKPF